MKKCCANKVGAKKSVYACIQQQQQKNVVNI